jgi:cysteinyl-tRNA synthetase
MKDEEIDAFEKTAEYVKMFEDAMDDDFNTADAITAVFELVKYANITCNAESSVEYVQDIKARLIILCDVLGLVVDKEDEVLDSEVEELIAARTQARRDKDFKKADEIRDLLLSKGIVLEDTREGVKWKRV